MEESEPDTERSNFYPEEDKTRTRRRKSGGWIKPSSLYLTTANTNFALEIYIFNHLIV